MSRTRIARRSSQVDQHEMTLAECKASVDGLSPAIFQRVWQSYLASFQVRNPPPPTEAGRLRMFAAFIERWEREGGR